MPASAAEAEAATMEVDTSAEQQPAETEAADDVDIDSDAGDDTILATGAKPPQRSADTSSSSTNATVSAMDRLNALLLQTEQFSSFVKRAPAEGSASKAASTRSHQTDDEKAEDNELIADELEEDEITQPQYTRLTAQPLSIAGEMRDYQLEALNWLIRLHEQNINGILADEMGLGKTLESLSLLSYLKAHRNYPGPHLVVVPKSTSSNWLREVGRWTPNLTAYKFHGNQEEREQQKKVLGTHDVTITTYEMVIREKSALRKINWRYLYIDEAHRIKNEHSLLSTVLRTFSTQHRLLITGTPLQNSLHELWALLNFLVPSMFDAAADFTQMFDLTSASAEEGDKKSIVTRLHRILRPFLLRRLKSDVEATLLPKIETNLHIGMSALQRQWYAKVLSREVEVLNAAAAQNKSKAGKLRLLNIVMQLRKCCNHPYLFQGAEPGPPYVEGEHIVDNSGKMVLLDRLLRRLKTNGHRVLIFSQMTRLLDILEDYMRWRGFTYARIDGQTKQEDRDDAMDAFNAPNSPMFAFLLSTRAGGLGINLQTADTVILYDSDWNPQMDLQAQDRAHRIGQKRQVRVFRFVTDDSIEVKIVERAMKKLYLDALVIKQGRLMDGDKQLDANELQEMVRFGASRIFQSTDSTVSDADIDVILEEGEQRTEEVRAKLKEVAGVSGGGLLNFSLSGDGEKNIMQFEGQDYTNARQQSASRPFIDFIALPERARKNNYNEAAYYREALRVSEKKDKSQPKVFKPSFRLDFQFFDDERLEELERKEFEGEQRYREMKAKRDEERREKKRLEKERVREEARKRRRDTEGAAVADDVLKDEEKAEEEIRATPSPSPSPSPTPSADGDNRSSKKRGRSHKKQLDSVPEEETKEEGAEPDETDDDEALREEAGCLTAEEEQEKEELEAVGFGDWTRKHFNQYIRAAERFGRDSEKEIADSGMIEGKTAKEVRAYHQAFLEHHTAIKEWEKLVERIEKGEAKREKLQHLQHLIDGKVKRHRRPLETLTLAYPTAQRQYTVEEDRFLLCTLQQVGYGQWDEVKAAVRRSWMFRFDWFLKSRSGVELQKRTDYLIKLIEKEEEELEAARKAAKSKGKGKTAASTTPAKKGAAAASKKGVTSNASASKKGAAVSGGKRKAEAAPAKRSHKKKK